MTSSMVSYNNFNLTSLTRTEKENSYNEFYFAVAGYGNLSYGISISLVLLNNDIINFGT
jgi:hypothetical protein